MKGLEKRATGAWLHYYPLAVPKPSSSLCEPRRWCVVHKSWKNDSDVIGHNSGKLSIFFSGLDLRISTIISAGRRPRFARILRVNWLNGVDAPVGAIFSLVDIQLPRGFSGAT